MKTYLYLITALMAATAFGQPMIPPSNISPTPPQTLVGRYSAGTGRGQSITLGGNLTLSSLGVLDATGGGGGGSGTVTSIPDGSTNGVTWTVATRTTTPTFTFSLGAITPSSIVASGTIGGSNLSGTNTGDQNLWRTIAVSGQDNVVPVSTTSTLTFAEGANVTLTTNNTTKTITIAATGGGGSGNVTNNATLASGNVILGGGTTVVGTSNISTTGGNNMAIPGNVTIGIDLAVTGNQTVGNITTGNMTVTGSVVFGSIPVNGALGSDDTLSGVTLTGLLAGATIAQWEAVYVGGSSTYLLADANGSGTYPARGLAVAGYSSTNPAIIVREGTVRNDAWSWTPGGTIYISATPGALTQTAPSTSGDKVQQVGFALTADIAYFNFASGEYLTVE